MCQKAMTNVWAKSTALTNTGLVVIKDSEVSPRQKISYKPINFVETRYHFSSPQREERKLCDNGVVFYDRLCVVG